MKLSDFYHEAILWTCYLENYPDPERYLNIYNLSMNDRPMFEHLGAFFPFDEYYAQCPGIGPTDGIGSLTLSKKSFILPWIYWPKTSSDSLCGKQIISPSAEMFTLLDNKVETKKMFAMLGLPTPRWSFVRNGQRMLEKPIENSAGGLGLSLTENSPGAGCFLEEYIPGCQSIGLQFFVYKEVEFICADEMLFHSEEQETFCFHGQKNVRQDELPELLMEGCHKLGEYLSDSGYKGFLGVDALVGNDGYFFLEVNPRGIAFLPAYFAASSHGWTDFRTYMRDGSEVSDEVVLLDFGARKKVIKRIDGGD
jgi:hypothetical protein